MTAARATVAGLLAAGALTLTGCGPGTPATVTTPAIGGATAATAPAGMPATAPAAMPAATGPAVCRTADLKLSKGRSDGAAGSSYTPLVFENTGARSCTLTGFPGVSLTDSPTGDPIGAPADRETPKPTVTLGVGEKASALLRITVAGNYGDRCHPATAAGLRVYPPDNTDSLYLPWQLGACTDADIHLLEISSIEPGEQGN
jgi:hypothetical protein